MYAVEMSRSQPYKMDGYAELVVIPNATYLCKRVLPSSFPKQPDKDAWPHYGNIMHNSFTGCAVYIWK